MVVDAPERVLKSACPMVAHDTAGAITALSATFETTRSEVWTRFAAT
jgi:hypothetical protein